MTMRVSLVPGTVAQARVVDGEVELLEAQRHEAAGVHQADGKVRRPAGPSAARRSAPELMRAGVAQADQTCTNCICVPASSTTSPFLS